MRQSLQDRYAPHNACFGCGPANQDGLRLQSFVDGDEVVCSWQPKTMHEAFPGVLNGAGPLRAVGPPPIENTDVVPGAKQSAARGTDPGPVNRPGKAWIGVRGGGHAGCMAAVRRE